MNEELYEKYLTILARCYKEKNFEEIYPYLSKDVIWESNWVKEPRVGYDAVVSYYNEKAASLIDSDHQSFHTLVKTLDPLSGKPSNMLKTEDGYAFLAHRPGLLLDHFKQIGEDGVSSYGIIQIEINKDNLISRIDLCMPEIFKFEEYKKLTMLDKIQEDEIDRIYRIEYMPSSNWTMGNDREIWTLNINKEDDTIERHLYKGKPLVPEYSRDSGYDVDYIGMCFENNFTAEKVYKGLHDCHLTNWETFNMGLTKDGMNYDIAFYTINKYGCKKIYRYLFMETSFYADCWQFFHDLFEVEGDEPKETITIDEEMTKKSSRLLPGNEIQE